VPWKIDPSRTQIGFSVKHMVIATVRGKFTRYDGVISLNDQHPERSAIEGWVEVARINTLDATRDAYLRSPDFFDAVKFPKIAFRSKKITPAGGDRFRLVGALSIKEATRDITFDVSYKGQKQEPQVGVRRSFTADASLNRHDFALNWNAALEAGGFLVGDEVKIHIVLEIVGEADA
jgi:polyisoprenoid-binding protein YceI